GGVDIGGGAGPGAGGRGRHAPGCDRPAACHAGAGRSRPGRGGAPTSGRGKETSRRKGQAGPRRRGEGEKRKEELAEPRRASREGTLREDAGTGAAGLAAGRPGRRETGKLADARGAPADGFALPARRGDYGAVGAAGRSAAGDAGRGRLA